MGERRPRDRRERVLAAASQLFRDSGYHNVSIADVATAVGVAPSALYRHFRNKNELLFETVCLGLQSLQDTVDGASDLDSLIARLSVSVSERRGLPLLWQREARHLDPEQRSELRRQLNAIISRVTDLTAADRPARDRAEAELVAISILAVFSSISSHRITLSRRRMEELLATLAHRVVNTKFGPVRSGETTTTPAVALSVSRRERLLTEATRLFDERGYQSVKNEDIGEAAGTTGPNVYNHFEAKVDILVTAVTRGMDRRALGATQALARAHDPEDAVTQLLQAHIEFVMEDPHLVGLMASELGQLPDRSRRTCVQLQREYTDIWLQVLRGVQPGLDTNEAKVTVSAALTVVANAARVGRLRRRPDLPERLLEIGRAVLLGP